MEQKIVDETETINSIKESHALAIRALTKQCDISLKEERELFEKYCPGEAWDDYYAKIMEDEINIPAPDRKYADDWRQAMYESINSCLSH